MKENVNEAGISFTFNVGMTNEVLRTGTIFPIGISAAKFSARVRDFN